MIRLPDGMRERIKAYAERNNRSMNAEIVRVLEREFPEPWPLERRTSELLEIVNVLKAGNVGAIDTLLAELEATLGGIVSGRLRGLSEDERDRIEVAFATWQEEQVRNSSREEPELDPMEEAVRDRIGTTIKFSEPDTGQDTAPQARKGRED